MLTSSSEYSEVQLLKVPLTCTTIGAGDGLGAAREDVARAGSSLSGVEALELQFGVRISFCGVLASLCGIWSFSKLSLSRVTQSSRRLLSEKQ